MTKKKTIITCNEEIFDKFNMLNFTSQVLLTKSSSKQVKTILDNINSNNKNLTVERLGNTFKITKINPINLNVYIYKRRNV